MILNPITTFILLIIGVSTFIFIMLLPALFELKRPKDAGPRMIMEYPLFTQPELGRVSMANVEEEQRLDQKLVEKIADIIAVLPNLEA